MPPPFYPSLRLLLRLHLPPRSSPASGLSTAARAYHQFNAGTPPRNVHLPPPRALHHPGPGASLIRTDRAHDDLIPGLAARRRIWDTRLPGPNHRRGTPRYPLFIIMSESQDRKEKTGLLCITPGLDGGVWHWKTSGAMMSKVEEGRDEEWSARRRLRPQHIEHNTNPAK